MRCCCRLSVLVFLLSALAGPTMARPDDERPPWERDEDDDGGEGEDEDRSEDDDGDEDTESEGDEDDGGEDEDEDVDPEEEEDEDDYEGEHEEGYDPYLDGDDEPRTRRRKAEVDPTDPDAVYRAGVLSIRRNRLGDEYPNAFAALFRVRTRWSVVRGDGGLFTPYKMARYLGDKGVANKVVGHQVAGFAAGGGAFVIGASLLIGGGVAVGLDRSGERNSRSRIDGVAATRALTAGAILGPILMVAGTSVTIGILRRTRQVAWYYDRGDAEDAIEDYNDDLRDGLDVSGRDRRGSVLPPRAELRLAAGPGAVSLTLTW